MAGHILLLGGTGPSGEVFIAAALEKGYILTIYARNISKLPLKMREYKRVRCVEGKLDDEARLEEAVTGGATVMVSLLGPTTGLSGTPITDCYKLLFPLLISNGFKHAIVACSFNWEAPEDRRSIFWGSFRQMMKVIANDKVVEMQAIGEYISSVSLAQLSWSMHRIPRLVDDLGMKLQEGFRGDEDGKDGFTLSRENMIEWIMSEIEKQTWMGRAPMLSSVKGDR